jgi:hypothetical protein
MEKNRLPTLCQVFYVTQSHKKGWKWRPITAEGNGKASAETYALFYECVIAARANGYTPNQRCL